MATKIEPRLDHVMMLDVPVNKMDIRVIRDAIDSIIVGVVVRFACSVIVIVFLSVSLNLL
jgi:hypothetical protein